MASPRFDRNAHKAGFRNQIDDRIGISVEQVSGLGLLLCKEFVSVNGGRIGAESVEGEGTTIWITLPLPTSRYGAGCIPPATGLPQ